MTVTLSLPEGMTLGPAAWRPVVGIALETLFDEPAERACWVGFARTIDRVGVRRSTPPETPIAAPPFRPKRKTRPKTLEGRPQ